MGTAVNPSHKAWESELSKNKHGKSKDVKLVELVEERERWYTERGLTVPRLPGKWFYMTEKAKVNVEINAKFG